MKKLFLLICIVLSFSTLGQKKYSFDYALVYKERCKEHQKPFEMIYLINSQKSNYKLLAHPKDSTALTIHFTDSDGVSVYGSMLKDDFFKVETITNDCSQIFRYRTLAKDQKQDYKIENCKDTLINDTTYYHYKMFSTKSIKYQKRKKIVTSHFIVNKKNDSNLDFTTSSIIFELDPEHNSIPKGIAKTIFFVNTEGEITSRLELDGILKTDRFLTIPEECDYTKEAIRNYMPKVTFGR